MVCRQTARMLRFYLNSDLSEFGKNTKLRDSLCLIQRKSDTRPELYGIIGKGRLWVEVEARGYLYKELSEVIEEENTQTQGKSCAAFQHILSPFGK